MFFKTCWKCSLSSMEDGNIKNEPYDASRSKHGHDSVIEVPGESENGADPNSSLASDSYSNTLFHILAVSVGPTVFIIPSTFKMVGYVYAMIGIIIIGLFYAYNVHKLLRSSDILCNRLGRSNLSFAEVVKYAFEEGPFCLRLYAPYAYTLMNALFVLSWGGELAFNVIFLTENMKNLLDYNLDINVDIHWIVVSLLIPCILITSVCHAELSVFSVIATIIDVFFLVVIAYVFNENFSGSVTKMEAVKPLTSALHFFGTIFFTLNFTGIAIPLRNKMKDSSEFDSVFGVLNVSIVIVTASNLLFGFMGYVQYGNDTSDTVTSNLPLNNVLVQIVIALYCVAVYFSYPSCYFVIFNIVWNEWASKMVENVSKSGTYECYTRIAINVVLFAFILVLPSLDLFTELGGLVCSVFDSIIIPSLLPILLLYNADGQTFSYVMVKNMLIVTFGVVLLFFGVLQCWSAIPS